MDIERMTGLPIDQLLDVTACVAPLIDPGDVAGWTALDLFESVVAMTVYVRQNATEDFIGAVFEVSQSTISRRRTLLEGPVAVALADLKPVPAEVTREESGMRRVRALAASLQPPPTPHRARRPTPDARRPIARVTNLPGQ